MRIPSVFERGATTDLVAAPVTGRINPGTEWVFTDDDVIARRLWDGIAVLCVVDDGVPRYYTRRTVDPEAAEPEGFIPADVDVATGQRFGWEPAEQSPFHDALQQALRHGAQEKALQVTYELVGPEVSSSARVPFVHELERHDTAEQLPLAFLRQEGIGPENNLLAAAAFVRTARAALGWDGVVFYHPDGRVAKMKATDAHEYLEHRAAALDLGGA